MSYIVFHAPSGAMDGVYTDEPDARRMLDYWRAEVPGDWLLLRIVAGESRWTIPDHLFAADVFAARSQDGACGCPVPDDSCWCTETDSSTGGTTGYFELAAGVAGPVGTGGEAIVRDHDDDSDLPWMIDAPAEQQQCCGTSTHIHYPDCPVIARFCPEPRKRDGDDWQCRVCGGAEVEMYISDADGEMYCYSCVPDGDARRAQGTDIRPYPENYSDLPF